MEAYLTADEVARLLRVHRVTVRDWLRRGDLPGFKLSDRSGWRVARADVAAFVAARKNRPARGG